MHFLIQQLTRRMDIVQYRKTLTSIYQDAPKRMFARVAGNVAPNEKRNLSTRKTQLLKNLLI